MSISYSAAVARMAEKSTSDSPANGEATSDIGALNKNPYLGVTARTPRPTPPEDGKFGPTGKESLARDQAAWDAAKAWDADNEARRLARFNAVNERREQAQAEIATEADARFVDGLRAAYLHSDPGATEADFQTDLPELRRQHRIAATLNQPSGEARMAELRRQAGR